MAYSSAVRRSVWHRKTFHHTILLQWLAWPRGQIAVFYVRTTNNLFESYISRRWFFLDKSCSDCDLFVMCPEIASCYKFIHSELKEGGEYQQMRQLSGKIVGLLLIFLQWQKEFKRRSSGPPTSSFQRGNYFLVACPLLHMFVEVKTCISATDIT